MDKKAFTNKQTALAFQQMIVDGEIAEAYKKYVAPDMRHHNAYIAGDRASLQKAMEENCREFPNTSFDRKHVIAEGDFVVVHSWFHTHSEDSGTALVNILRFENNLIAEIWDIDQLILKDSPNEHGMF